MVQPLLDWATRGSTRPHRDGHGRRFSWGADLSKPFGALPPRGRRHVLAQLEKEEGLDERWRQPASKVHPHFYGAIYQFKDAFDRGQIPGAYMETGIADQQDYVRCVELINEANAMQKVLLVLHNVLKGMPVYFEN